MASSGTATQSFPSVVHLPPRRTMIYYAIAATAVLTVYVFRHTITLAVIAFATAYVFAPIVRRVERYGVPRPLATVLVLFTATANVAGVLSTLVPELVRQAQVFVQSIPQYSVALQHTWIPWLRQHAHISLPRTTEEILSQLGVQASGIAPRIGAVLNGTLEYGIAVVEVLFLGLVIFALTFYLLLDFESVIDDTFDLVPHRARAQFLRIAHEIDDTLRHFVTGQLLVMAVLGFLYAVGLSVVSVPAGWAIGAFAGLISFVPYLGFFVALGLALFMAALQGPGVAPLVAVAAAMTAVHILDLTLITPRILGGRVKLSPVTTILALIGGGSVFGFVGVLLAIPVASVLKVLLREAVEYYKTTAFFNAVPATALQSAPGALRSDLNSATYVPTGGEFTTITPPPPIQPAALHSATPTGKARETSP